MRTDDAFEALLRDWGRSHGGSRYENIGYPSKNVLATVIEHRGDMPSGSQIAKLCVRLDSPADQVEAAVLQMHRQGIDGEADAHCLRVMYDESIPDMESRIRRLHAIGHRVRNMVLATIKRQRVYERAARARNAVRVVLGVYGRDAA